MDRYTLRVILGISFFLGGASAPLAAVTVGALRDIPAGTIRYSVHEGNKRHFIEINWGGDTEDTGSSGPVAKITVAGSTTPAAAKIGEEALDRLFDAAAKLGEGYLVPRSTTSDRSNRDMFQLYVGLKSDPVRLSFPSNEPALWNRAAACWIQYAEILKKDASLALPEVKRIEPQTAADARSGLPSLADYTSVRLSAERVDRSKPDYGTISAEWIRSKDGTITFSASYQGRTGDRLKATPAPAQIRPIFDELRKLSNGYCHPSFARNKKVAASRDYDSIDIGIIATDQPGEFLLPFFSTDTSQWASADRLWSLLLQLFPEEQRGKIIQ